MKYGGFEVDDALVAAGCVPPLAQLLSHPSADTVEDAASAMSCLAEVSDAHRYAIVASGCLPLLSRLLAHPSVWMVRSAVLGVSRLAACSTIYCDEMVAASSLHHLSALAQSDPAKWEHGRGPEIVEAASAAALHSVESSSKKNREAVAAAGEARAAVGL